MSEKKLFLLDGHALVYRAHFAFITRPLLNSKGQNVSAINGFLRSLWDLITHQKPTHLAVSFDLEGDTFRHTMYEQYKAHRDAQPEDITFAIPWIHKILEAFNIPIVTCEGYEADDVIGTIAKQAEQEGFKVYMMTPDKDYAQLVSENIFLYKPARMGNDVEIMGVDEVLNSWQISNIGQVIDFLGLKGDAVDNIPGIPGIGDKTAVDLLSRYGTVENLIANSHELKGKQRENIEKFAEQGLLSKILATIDINVPIRFDAVKYEIEPINKPELAEIFKELEFRTFAKTILGIDTTQTTTASPGTAVQGSLFGDQPAKESNVKMEIPDISGIHARYNIGNTDHEYIVADTDAELYALIETLSKLDSFCFDTETTGIDANDAEIVGMSFSWEKGRAYYIPFSADQAQAKERLELFRPVFENEKIAKTGQNIKYDALLLKWYGIEVKGDYFDTMIAHYLIEPDLRHNMDYLAETYLEYSPVPISDLIGKGKEQLSMRSVPIERIKEYAAEDADITLQLKDKLAPRLASNNLEPLFHNIETPLIKVLVDLEFNGIKVDTNYLSAYSKELGNEIVQLEKKILTETGLKFNIASPKQVGEVLFEHLKIPYRWKKTSSGQYSTDEEKLTELSGEFQIVDEILKHRGLSKLLSTYVDALPKMINPKSGRIHSSFNQALAATGRLSSNNPNLQNIPIRTREGRKVREAFVPRDSDHLLLSADYSQIELRLIAHIAGEKAMLDAFAAGHDIHQATAAKVYNVPLDQVTPDQRRNAKTVNFSIIYGAGSQNLSRQLNIKRAEAKELIDQYFNTYADLKRYMVDTVEFARKNGYVETLLGRKRILRDIDSRNAMMRSGAERIAINTPIQGSAADMIKIAMINVFKAFTDKKIKSKMILQVHDELVFDVVKEEVDVVTPIIIDCMKNAIPNLKVPIEVGIGTGNNWLESH